MESYAISHEVMKNDRTMGKEGIEIMMIRKVAYHEASRVLMLTVRVLDDPKGLGLGIGIRRV